MLTGDSGTSLDADLIQRLLAGEQAVFDEIVRTYYLSMTRVACAIVGEGEAE